MAKHVTEKELASGLAGFGDGFSSIAESRPRRDSPFRDTRESEPEPAYSPAAAPAHEALTSEPTLPAAHRAREPREEKVVEIVRPKEAEKRPAEARRAEEESLSVPIEPRPAEVPPGAHSRADLPTTAADPGEDLLQRARAYQAHGDSPNRVHAAPPAPRTVAESAREVRILPPDEHAPVRKEDVFTERVTLKISSEMRDAVDALAKELQRRRTKKHERITANTVMRVAISHFLARLELDAGDLANDEDELLELVGRKL